MMVKAIKQGAHVCTHPVTVHVGLHFLHYTLVFQCFFLCFNFPSCSWLNFEKEGFGRPDNHQYVFGSGILLETVFLHSISVLFWKIKQCSKNKIKDLMFAVINRFRLLKKMINLQDFKTVFVYVFLYLNFAIP